MIFKAAFENSKFYCMCILSWFWKVSGKKFVKQQNGGLWKKKLYFNKKFWSGLHVQVYLECWSLIFPCLCKSFTTWYANKRSIVMVSSLLYSVGHGLERSSWGCNVCSWNLSLILQVSNNQASWASTSTKLFSFPTFRIMNQLTLYF